MLENIDKRALVWALEVAAEYISLSENWKGNDAHLREDAKLIRWVLGEKDVHYRVNVKIEEAIMNTGEAEELAKTIAQSISDYYGEAIHDDVLCELDDFVLQILLNTVGLVEVETPEQCDCQNIYDGESDDDSI